MGKYNTQLQLVTGKRAVEAYSRQQAYHFPEISHPEIIDYVPANETVRANPNQIIHTQTNHYHYSNGSSPNLRAGPKKSTVPDFEITLALLYATGMALFLLGFLISAVLR